MGKYLLCNREINIFFFLCKGIEYLEDIGIFSMKNVEWIKLINFAFIL